MVILSSMKIIVIVSFYFSSFSFAQEEHISQGVMGTYVCTYGLCKVNQFIYQGFLYC